MLLDIDVIVFPVWQVYLAIYCPGKSQTCTTSRNRSFIHFIWRHLPDSQLVYAGSPVSDRYA